MAGGEEGRFSVNAWSHWNTHCTVSDSEYGQSIRTRVLAYDWWVKYHLLPYGLAAVPPSLVPLSVGYQSPITGPLLRGQRTLSGICGRSPVRNLIGPDLRPASLLLATGPVRDWG